MDLVLFNFTPGTSSNADYTTPSMPEYLSSQTIYDRILGYEAKDPHGLNGFILLIHIGTDPERTDKFYLKLGDLIGALKEKGYALVRLDELLRLP
jgi:peptidoglycan/xylan/chitin deacetylase (PgdA/CDA1 family)